MDPYETLEITPGFSGDLRAQRNRLVKRHFEAGEAPDEERMKAINIAYEALRGRPVVVTAPAAGPPAIVTDSLPRARAGEPYRATLDVRGALTADRLPAGLTLDGDTLVGLVQRPGSFPLTLIAQRGELTVERVFVMHVEPAPLRVLTRELQGVLISDYYEADLEVAGGVEPYRWSGEMPAGLQLGDGLVFGTPLGPPGDHTLRLRVRDHARQVVDFQLVLTVHARFPARAERRRNPAAIATAVILAALVIVLSADLLW